MDCPHPTLFRPPEDDPRKCDRYEANKNALILIARANILKTKTPTPENEELHDRTLNLAVDERDFCRQSRFCVAIEECKMSINKDLGISS